MNENSDRPQISYSLKLRIERKAAISYHLWSNLAALLNGLINLLSIGLLRNVAVVSLESQSTQPPK